MSLVLHVPEHFLRHIAEAKAQRQTYTQGPAKAVFVGIPAHQKQTKGEQWRNHHGHPSTITGRSHAESGELKNDLTPSCARSTSHTLPMDHTKLPKVVSADSHHSALGERCPAFPFAFWTVGRLLRRRRLRCPAKTADNSEMRPASRIRLPIKCRDGFKTLHSSSLLHEPPRSFTSPQGEDMGEARKGFMVRGPSTTNRHYS